LNPKSAPYTNKGLRPTEDFKQILSVQNTKLLKKSLPNASPPPPPPPSILNQMHQQQQLQQASLTQLHTKPASPLLAHKNFNARVLYSYIPVNEDELAIQENGIVKVIRLVEDGWYEGIYAGKQGVFPSNYVEKIDENSGHSPVAVVASPQEVTEIGVDASTKSLENNSYTETGAEERSKLNNKSKKVMGIGLGNIFSGKQIELKTKENFSNQRSALSVEHNEQQNERYTERQIADSISKASRPGGETKLRARVLYEYLPTQPDELHLVPGEYVYITDKNIDDEGWYRGESIATGAVGVFPDNFVEEEPETMEASSVVLKDQGLNSLTTSSVSISSSNNSLSKQQASKCSPTGQLQAAIEPEGEVLSEDLNAASMDESNKLVHIKKTKQMNKRPPSFRKKKPGQSVSTESADVEPELDTTLSQPSGQPFLEDQSAEVAEEEAEVLVVQEDSRLVKSPTPVLVSSPQLASVSALGLGKERPLTGVNSVNGTVSEMSMATGVTILETSPSNKEIFNEVDSLREQLNSVRSENGCIREELRSLKTEQEEAMRKMKKKFADLVSEIDEEKKTRLALQVELERIKKNIMLYQ